MKLKKIINIMPDEKFLDYYISMSEKFNTNLASYLVFTNNQDLKYIKADNSNLFVLPNDKSSYGNLSNKINENDVIVFHGFNLLHKEFIEKLPPSVKKIWIFWGYDGYGAFPYYKYIRFNSFRLQFPNSIIGNIRFFKNLFSGFFVTKRNKNAISLIQKMDYCTTWVDKDYELIKKFNKEIKQLYFNYYTDELMNFNFIKKTPINKQRIFLGNSANHTNNHIEALNFLYKNKFSGEIVCPLSYSGEDLYINNIVNLGKKMFGDRFIPLLGFIPLQDYQEIINSCGIVWMNHIRQQAAGNLFAAFCSGKMVVLDERNSLYDTFSKWGLIFFKKEDIFKFKDTLVTSLNINREIILKKVTVEENRPFFNTLKHICLP